MTTSTLNLTADIIDTRDIIERLEELEGIETPTEEEQAELDSLAALMDELEGLGGDEQWRGDWYPQCLISNDYFDEHMDQMAEDCGYMPKDLPFWMSVVLDYDALRMDYTNVEIGENTYWCR
jgi:hypothetical protein